MRPDDQDTFAREFKWLEARFCLALRDWRRAQCRALVAGDRLPAPRIAPSVGDLQALMRVRLQFADSQLRRRAELLHHAGIEIALEVVPAVAAARSMALERIHRSGTVDLGALSRHRSAAARVFGYDDYVSSVLDRAGAVAGDLERAFLELSNEPVGGARHPSELQGARVHVTPNDLLEFCRRRGLDLTSAALCVPAKPAVARTLLCDAPSDVRVVVALDGTNTGLRRCMHELGHAWWGLSANPDMPWLMRDAPGRVHHEALAEWLADASDGAHFAQEVLNLQEQAARHRESRRRNVRPDELRVTLARAWAEIHVYEDGTDWPTCWRRAAQRLQVRPEWIAPIERRLGVSVVQEPGAQIVYLLAERLRRAIIRRVGDATELNRDMVARAQRWMHTARAATEPSQRR